MKEQLLRGLLDISLGPVEQMSSHLLKVIYDITGGKRCSLWKISYSKQFLSVQAREGYHSLSQEREEFILPMQDSLLGYLTTKLLNDKKEYLDIDSIREPEYWEKIRHQQFADELKLERMIVVSIPTLPVSSNESPEIEAILVIYPKDKEGFKSGCTEIIRKYFSLALSRLNSIRREQLAYDIAQVYEKKATKDLASILHPIIRDVLKKYLQYEGCSIFQWDPYLNRLFLIQAITEIECPPWWTQERQPKRSDVFYLLDEGLTGTIAKNQKPLIFDEVDCQRFPDCLKHKWQEKTDHPATTFAGISIMKPSRPKKLLGVIRFTNKLNPLLSFVDYFNRLDIELIQHACRMIALYMEEEQNEQLHATIAKQMVHELMTPAVAVRGTAHRLLKKWSSLLQDQQERKINDWINSILDHIEFQITQLRNIQLIRNVGRSSRHSHYQVDKKFDFQKDIIAPCKKMLVPVTAGKSLSFDKIVLKGNFPELWVDKYAFQEIFFNLLTNAFKYRDQQNDDSFQILIKSHGREMYNIPKEARGNENNRMQRLKGFLLTIEDHGISIDSAQKDRIFELGYRTPRAEQLEVRGLGIGLTIVEQILKDFYGNIWVTQFKKPTEFDIFLPEKLQDNTYIEDNDWKSDEF